MRAMFDSGVVSPPHVLTVLALLAIKITQEFYQLIVFDQSIFCEFEKIQVSCSNFKTVKTSF